MEDSVYDFIYADLRRIAQFLSQFNQYGHLTNLTRTENLSKTLNSGFNVTVAKLEGNSTSAEGQTRQFDQQWVIPLNFLDEAQDRNLIIRDLKEARIGQFVLTSGSLAILDLKTLKELWDLPLIQEIIASGIPDEAPEMKAINRHAKRTAATTGRKTSNSDPKAAFMKMVLDVIKILPHGVHARMRTASDKVIWCGLNEDSLIGSSADLLLKHGIEISGSWNILGILDAFPETLQSTDEERLPVVSSDETFDIAHVMSGLGPAARQILGRPATA